MSILSTISYLSVFTVFLVDLNKQKEIELILNKGRINFIDK